MTSLFYSCPKEREVPGQLELDLKSYRKLRVDLLENLPYCTGVLDNRCRIKRKQLREVQALKEGV
jgi:hypothetical protein